MCGVRSPIGIVRRELTNVAGHTRVIGISFARVSIETASKLLQRCFKAASCLILTKEERNNVNLTKKQLSNKASCHLQEQWRKLRSPLRLLHLRRPNRQCFVPNRVLVKVNLSNGKVYLILEASPHEACSN